MRKFGWLKLVSQKQLDAISGQHGIEPLTPAFTFLNFKKVLARYPNRKIKQLLLDQKLIAGVGNIYADESCFAARILPTRQIKTLKEKEVKLLFTAISRILKLSIKKGGTSADDFVRTDGTKGGFLPYLKVYGRGGQPCKVCRTKIEKIKLNGRGTHYCPRCQKGN
ncbi:MAG: zinc finger domain-containing protein [Patescibacteria group bacterium]